MATLDEVKEFITDEAGRFLVTGSVWQQNVVDGVNRKIAASINGTEEADIEQTCYLSPGDYLAFRKAVNEEMNSTEIFESVFVYWQEEMQRRES
ncbi:MAG: hypothetical protein ACTSWQ_00875 [Candidatus Thorarchaeota archaeon]